MAQQFYPMTEIPPQVDGEWFSETVLVYDRAEPTFAALGFYNFDTEMWSHFHEESMQLICWTFIPNPTEFVNQNPQLEWVRHTGYQD